ncbi:3-oxoacyl-ACP synthase III family protein [Streptomyces sp. NPDC001351]|uniref:3-oxoacyl-ACP synthase III family protein n=1 Tax=Streptomyces sp. NPDC001351 TaxID=3364564 RepID=UPI0036D083A7
MTTAPIGILATGSYVPGQVVTNAELAQRFDVTTEWIERKTGILTRRYADEAEATSDLAHRAAVRALAQADLRPDELTYIIVATTTGDHPLPPTASLLQERLGAWQAGCFDLNVACSGFVYGLAVAAGLLATAHGGRALVVGADIWSRFIDPSDRATAVLLSDGAGAAVLGSVPAGQGILGTDLTGYGDLSSLLVVPAGGSSRPASQETVENREHVLHMRGREVSEFALTKVPTAVKDVLAQAGVTPAEVDHFVPHQANGALLDRLTGLLDLENARTHRTVACYGNSGAASIAVTLDEAHRESALRPGDLVLLAGFGGGMATGTCLLRWSAQLSARTTDSERKDES